jgi:hypothetical protein
VTGGSSGILLLLLGAFLLTSFITGRLDWLKNLAADTSGVRNYREGVVDRIQGGQSTPAPFGPTGAAPTTSGAGRTAT